MQLKKITMAGLIAMLTAMSPYVVHAGDIEIPKLTSSAQAIIQKPSDELQLQIGVVTLGDRAQVALADNTKKMQAVIASLETAGITKDEYETGQFSINPTFTPYPKNPPPNWKPSINGYEVSNSVMIHTNKLDMAGKFIDAANKAGANTVSDLHFGLHNPRIHWTEALNAAVENAIADAKAMASAAGVSLVRVMSITLDNTHTAYPRINTAYLKMSAEGGSTPPIEPNDVKITANVTIVYEITSK
jgi:uncharacterized protein YggE